VIRKIQIENYKSIDKLEFELGRVSVLIGENGAGKSNILEAIALTGAASANKLENEFLASRGIRVTHPDFMRPAFPGFEKNPPIIISLPDKNIDLCFELHNDGKAFSKWEIRLPETRLNDRYEQFTKSLMDVFVKSQTIKTSKEDEKKLILTIKEALEFTKDIKAINYEKYNGFSHFITDIELRKPELTGCTISDFLIYSPENSALRTFHREGQIEPLGINGEGLLKLLSVISQPEYSEVIQKIKNSLKVLGWFEDLHVTEADPFAGSRLEIKDRYLNETPHYFDQLSTNEGFLFLLFYFTLFSTDLTPKFFAIDNIDASLNPKLCEKLMLELVRLAEKHDKQVILTTHNPAILDGLNIDDDEQRLFVISRNKTGATRMKRVNKPTTPAGERPVRLSEMFLRGILGGLPKGF